MINPFWVVDKMDWHHVLWMALIESAAILSHTMRVVGAPLAFIQTFFEMEGWSSFGSFLFGIKCSIISIYYSGSSKVLFALQCTIVKWRFYTTTITVCKGRGLLSMKQSISLMALKIQSWERGEKPYKKHIYPFFVSSFFGSIHVWWCEGCCECLRLRRKMTRPPHR